LGDLQRLIKFRFVSPSGMSIGRKRNRC
jgi:hypothetical protein